MKHVHNPFVGAYRICLKPQPLRTVFVVIFLKKRSQYHMSTTHHTIFPTTIAISWVHTAFADATRDNILLAGWIMSYYISQLISTFIIGK